MNTTRQERSSISFLCSCIIHRILCIILLSV